MALVSLFVYFVSKVSYLVRSAPLGALSFLRRGGEARRDDAFLLMFLAILPPMRVSNCCVIAFCAFVPLEAGTTFVCEPLILCNPVLGRRRRGGKREANNGEGKRGSMHEFLLYSVPCFMFFVVGSTVGMRWVHVYLACEKEMDGL